MSDILVSTVSKSKKPFIIISEDAILTFEHLCDSKTFLKTVQDLIIKGDVTKTLAYLKILEEPNLFIMRGRMYKANKRISLDLLDKKIEMLVEQRLLKERGEDSNKRILFLNALIKIPKNQRNKFIKNNISFWIVSEQDIKNVSDFDKITFWAVQEMKSYIVEYKGTEGEGQWMFPRCALAIPMTVIPPNNALMMIPQVCILDPPNYKHPFVFSSRGVSNMCMGDFTASNDGTDLSTKWTIFDKVIEFFDIAKQILISGYIEGAQIHPAGEHITHPVYEEFKISQKVSDRYKSVLENRKLVKKSKRRVVRRSA